MNSIDILNHDCLSEILKYLPVRDLLNFSLVSRKFSESLSSSKKNLERIYLRFYEPLGDIECLMSSSREYSSFKLQHAMPAKMNHVFNKFKWKHAMLRDQERVSYKKFIKFMTQLALTVETLDLWDINMKTEVADFIKVDFSRLRKLEMNLTNRAVFSIFLGNNPMLKILKINDSSVKFPRAQDQMMVPTNLIHELIKANKLTELKLLYCTWAFEHDLTESYTSKTYLKTITVTFDTSLNVPNTQINNIRKFIGLKRYDSVECATGNHLTINYLE